MAKLLLVEDNPELAATIAGWLREDGHVIDIAVDGLAGESMMLQFDFDLLVFDWKLPGKSGIELCKSFRQSAKCSPILMLTAKGDLEDKVAGLEAGADDYLTKPFQPQELRARVKALLRRATTFVGSVLVVGDLQLNLETREASCGDRQIQLPRQEFSLLEFFMRRPGRVTSAEAILNGVWQTDSETTLDAVYICIRRLRRKLNNIGSDALSTVHGQGYLLKA